MPRKLTVMSEDEAPKPIPEAEFSFEDAHSPENPDEESEKKTRKERADKGRKRGPRGPRSLGNISQSIEAILTITNQFVFLTNPQLRDYAITADEMPALSSAIEMEVKSSARLSRMVANTGKLAPHVALINCLGTMAFVRWQIYQQKKAEKVAGNEDEKWPDSPVPVGEGRAFNGDGRNGDGEDVSRIAYTLP